MGEIHLQALTQLTILNYYLEQYYLEQWASCLTAGRTRHRVTGLKDATQFVKVMDEALAAYQGELDRMGVQVCRK